MPLTFKSEMDDSDYMSGLRRMEAGAANSARKINKSIKDIDSGGHGGRGAADSFAWALRDAAEGRTGAGMVRLGDSIGVVGGAFAGAIGVITAAKVTLEKYDEIADRTRETSDKLSESLVNLSDKAGRMNFTATAGALEGMRQQLIEQNKKENVQQGDLANEAAMAHGASLGGVFGGFNPMGAYVKARDWLTGAPSAEDKQRESDMRERAAAGDISKLGKKEKLSRESAEDETLGKSRKAALQKEIEDGNKIYMAGEEEKRRMRMASEKNDRDLDEANAKDKLSDLRKQIEEGNKLYLDAEKKKKDVKKGALQEQLADQQRVGAQARANLGAAQEDLGLFDRSSGDDRRQQNRDYQREQRIKGREQRMMAGNATDARSGARRRNAAIAAAQKAVDLSDASVAKLVAAIDKLVTAP